MVPWMCSALAAAAYSRLRVLHGMLFATLAELRIAAWCCQMRAAARGNINAAALSAMDAPKPIFLTAFVDQCSFPVTKRKREKREEIEERKERN